jgi:hypothetical protein
MKPPSAITCQNRCNRSGRMKIEYSATASPNQSGVAITGRTRGSPYGTAHANRLAVLRATRLSNNPMLTASQKPCSQGPCERNIVTRLRPKSSVAPSTPVGPRRIGQSSSRRRAVHAHICCALLAMPRRRFVGRSCDYARLGQRYGLTNNSMFTASQTS